MLIKLEACFENKIYQAIVKLKDFLISFPIFLFLLLIFQIKGFLLKIHYLINFIQIKSNYLIQLNPKFLNFKIFYKFESKNPHWFKNLFLYLPNSLKIRHNYQYFLLHRYFYSISYCKQLVQQTSIFFQIFLNLLFLFDLILKYLYLPLN